MNLVLKLSKLCNLRCAYCYEFEHLAQPARMPLAGLDRLFDSLGDWWSREGGGELHFALHGGEPLLLPPDYFAALVDLQRRHLAGRGIVFRNAVQTNLYRVPPGMPERLAELDIGIGVSLDVHGKARVDARGSDAEARVRRNLERLLASGVAGRIEVGGISVLHAGNVDRAGDTFRFFAAHGLDYRILPIFSMVDPPARMRPLMLDPAQVVAALLDVLQAQLAWKGRPVRVHPLEDYLEAAVRKSSGMPGPVYDPGRREWALIVDTNGDVYNHAEAYDARYRFGNAFAQPMGDVMRSAARRRATALREARAGTCKRCGFDGACPRLPVVEALPSERVLDGDGRLACLVARPMIEHCLALVAACPPAGKRYALPRAARRHPGGAQEHAGAARREGG